MLLPEFKLESYFAKWEFKAKALLCASDVESYSMQEVLGMADRECAKLWNGLRLGYTETKGMPLLRQEIANMYSKAEAEEILCFAGAEEGIYCTMRALLKGGDHVIVITPCYQSLEILPRSITGNVSAIQLKPEKNWELDLKEVEDALTPKTRMIVMNFPHNPTGAILKREDQERLAALARKQGIIILSDEVYRLLELNGEQIAPALSDVYERGISLSVTSKAFGLGGLRIGWIAARDPELLKAIAEYKHYTSLCNSAPSEVLALIALRNREEILKSRREIIQANLARLDAFFARQTDKFEWVRPRSGPVCFARLLSGNDSEMFCKMVLDALGILLLPASVYQYPGPYFRIGFGRRNMPELLDSFEAYVEESMP